MDKINDKFLESVAGSLYHLVRSKQTYQARGEEDAYKWAKAEISHFCSPYLSYDRQVAQERLENGDPAKTGCVDKMIHILQQTAQSDEVTDEAIVIATDAINTLKTEQYVSTLTSFGQEMANAQTEADWSEGKDSMESIIEGTDVSYLKEVSDNISTKLGSEYFAPIHDALKHVSACVGVEIANQEGIQDTTASLTE